MKSQFKLTGLNKVLKKYVIDDGFVTVERCAADCPNWDPDLKTTSSEGVKTFVESASKDEQVQFVIVLTHKNDEMFSAWKLSADQYFKIYPRESAEHYKYRGQCTWEKPCQFCKMRS